MSVRDTKAGAWTIRVARPVGDGPWYSTPMREGASKFDTFGPFESRERARRVALFHALWCDGLLTEAQAVAMLEGRAEVVGWLRATDDVPDEAGHLVHRLGAAAAAMNAGDVLPMTAGDFEHARSTIIALLAEVRDARSELTAARVGGDGIADGIRLLAAGREDARRERDVARREAAAHPSGLTEVERLRDEVAQLRQASAMQRASLRAYRRLSEQQRGPAPSLDDVSTACAEKWRGVLDELGGRAGAAAMAAREAQVEPSRPEPPPVDRGEPVTPPLVEWLRGRGLDGEARVVEARAAFGMTKYGQPLMTHDGRDPIEDARQELADALQYIQRAAMLGADLTPIAELLAAVCGRVIDAQQRAGANHAAHGPLTPTRFVVGGPDAIDDRWAHVVEHRGRGRWAALVHGFDVLGVDGTTLPAEPLPSSRDDAYLAASRFDRPSAAAAALRAYKCGPRCCYCASRRAVTA